MISQTAEYALRAVVHLAQQEGSEPVRVGQMAERLEVPQNYLSKILHVLARDGVLASARGPAGGFWLAVPSDELTLAQVVDPFDAVSRRSRCLLGRPECRDDHACPAHERWKRVAAEIRSFFQETTIATLLRNGAPILEAKPAGD